MEPTARRLFRLVEPIHLVTYFADEPTNALMALGHRNYWDGYFAGQEAAPHWAGSPPGWSMRSSTTSPSARSPRHIPRVWDTATPEAALAAREAAAAVAALRRILDDLADAPSLARAAELGTRAAIGAPTEGRVLYAALSSLPRPRRSHPVARLWHPAFPAPRAPRRRSHLRFGHRGYRRDGGPCASRSLRGHPSGEVRQSPPPPCGAAGRRCRQDARPRPHRCLRLAQ